MGFAVCLSMAALPGLLTNGVELYRILLTFPFLTFLAAVGAYGLMTYRNQFSHLFLVFFLIITSFFLDIHNYVNHYCDNQLVPAEKQWRNVQYFNAFNILKNLSEQQGPIYIFSGFNTDYDNKTLNIACNSFDALHNPSLSSTSPKWAVIIANLQYGPYFIQHFPGLWFETLKTDKTTPDDPKPFGIFFIPTAKIPSLMLEHWKKADEIYQEIDFGIQNKRSTDLWAGFMQPYPFLGEQFSDDRFLTAVYWEKIAFLKFLDAYFIQATEAYQNALTRGIPAAHLYYDLAVCLKIQNKLEKSKESFEKAAALSIKIN